MRASKIFSFMCILVLAVLLLTGCQTASPGSQSQVDSGVIDQDYAGTPNPEVPKELKLTEKEKKEGVQKITIKCGVEKEIPREVPEEPAGNTQPETQQAGGEQVAKPKI